MSATPHTQNRSSQPNPPKSLLSSIIFAFVLPLGVIVGLIAYMAAGSKPVNSSVDPQKAVAERIQKVGSVQIRAANRTLSTGEEVYKAQCSACHAAGVAGAPKFSDAAAWGPRIKVGFDALLQSALKGKNAMSPQGGGNFSDIEIGRAVAFMANAGGAKFVAPSPAAAPKE